MQELRKAQHPASSQLAWKRKAAKMPREIRDLLDMPNFNWETQKGRGDWSTRDVSAGAVSLDDVWRKPTCRDHGAMNAVTPARDIWRCLACGRSCFMAAAE